MFRKQSNFPFFDNFISKNHSFLLPSSNFELTWIRYISDLTVNPFTILLDWIFLLRMFKKFVSFTALANFWDILVCCSVRSALLWEGGGRNFFAKYEYRIIFENLCIFRIPRLKSSLDGHNMKKTVNFQYSPLYCTNNATMVFRGWPEWYKMSSTDLWTYRGYEPSFHLTSEHFPTHVP